MTSIVYDYIIIGAGAAGLMLADAIGKDAYFKDATILLLDKDAKNTNDRTWCFWEKGEGQFDAIVHKQWHQILFTGKQFAKQYKIKPYTYKMVRGIDFYSAYMLQIAAYPNITFKQAQVEDIHETETAVTVKTTNDTYTAKKVLNSIFSYDMLRHQQEYPVLQQHFIGWVIQSKTPIFNKEVATYMDFSIPQKDNTRFMYVLPYSEHAALVEYTLFSKDILPKVEYETAIKAYINETMGCTDYEIVEKEMGSIPMTCYNFKEYQSKRIRTIGTAGGWAKPSTGYTFMSTAQKVPALVSFLKTGKPLNTLSFKNRFWYYDLLLLDVLYNKNHIGHTIFQRLFKNRKPQLIFKFLDEKTTLIEELYYIAGCPKLLFTKALFKRILGRR